MKKISIFLWSVLAAAAVMTACHPVDPTPEPEPDPDPVPPTPEVVYTPLKNAVAGYYGDYFKSGADNHYIQLYNGKIDPEGYLDGECTSISFDLFSPLKGAPGIPDGRYLASATLKEFTFEAGVNTTWRVRLQAEADYLSSFFGVPVTVEELMKEQGLTADRLDDPTYDYGADFFRRDASGVETDLGFANGEIVVANIPGGSVDIKIVFELGGETFRYEYTGKLDIQDLRKPEPGPDPQPGPDPYPDGDIKLDAKSGDATNWGAQWPGAAPGYNNWSVMLYADESGTSGEFVEIDLVTADGIGRNLPAGVYKIVDPVASNIVPGVAVGYYEEHGFGLGCFYGAKRGIDYEGNSGEVTISKEGSVYTIYFTMTDTKASKTITGSFTGELAFYDYS